MEWATGDGYPVTHEDYSMKSLEENPEGITRAQIVVGIPSYNEANHIAFPTQQADKGLRKFFADRSAVIINCDNYSPDGTKEVFLGTQTKTPKIYLSTPPGVRGKGNNLRNLFARSVELSAEAVIVVDADLKSMTPNWIRSLGGPLFEGYHFVAPLYVRHKYEGIITNSIAYPLTRALYGRRVRQPLGGDYGFSGELARVFAEAPTWSEHVGDVGIDVWMTIVAVRSRHQVIQSFMGRPKIHRPKEKSDELNALFRNVVGTIFELMCSFENFWKDVRWSRPTSVWGFGLAEMEVAPEAKVDTRSHWDIFMEGLRIHRYLYREVLHADNLNKLDEVAELQAEAFEFPTGLWAKILYDFAVAYRNQPTSREALLTALLSLYHGKTLSFVQETQAMNSQQVEEFIEDQCLQFEKSKQYLLERWFAS